MAEYIRFLYAEGKSPATINLVVSAVKWMAEYRGADTEVGDITARTMSEIRGEGKERERRQVDGLTWDDVERVCAAAESSDTAAGLRDAAMISLMSDCLLRISEAVAVNVQDVQDEGLQVHSKKADAEKRGEFLYICESTRQLIERYRRRAGIAAGALFRRIRFQNHVTDDRLGVKGAREAIQRRAAEAGVEGLWLHGNRITEVSPVEDLINLENLNLANNDIRDLSPLKRLTNLKWLSVGFNSVSDISPLAKLEKLEGLWIQGNLISDISVLEGLTRLNDLGLHYNRISDLSVLEGLTRLIRLEFDINSLSDFSLLRGLRNLNMLKVEIEGPLPLSFLVDGEWGGGVLKVYVSKFE